MPPSYITIPRGEYLALLQEARRGAEVCGEMGDLRVVLLTLERRVSSTVDKTFLDTLRHAIESCDDVSRLRVELTALERRLREFDGELTPMRPPSRTDIQAAFDNSIDFARGLKKPPEKPPGAGG